MSAEANGSGADAGPTLALPGDLLCLAAAHELKNDQQALIGLLQIIEEDERCSVRARMWAGRGRRIAEASAARLRAVSGALIESSGATVGDASEGIGSLIHRVVEGVNLRADPGAPVHAQVDGGEVRVERPFLLEIVLTNLLTNALHATPEGARPPRLVAAATGGGAWTVQIEDSGAGFPERARKVLAGEADAMTELDFTRAAAHWGLGLMLVRAAAVAAGWEVRAVPRGPQEQGSTVTVRGRPARGP